jgi:hypothetical protein
MPSTLTTTSLDTAEMEALEQFKNRIKPPFLGEREYAVMSAVIDNAFTNPPTTHIALAQRIGMSTNTFESTLNHARTKLVKQAPDWVKEIHEALGLSITNIGKKSGAELGLR